MQPTNSSLVSVPRSVALHKAVHEPLVTELLSTIGPGEEAPVVLVRLQLNHPGTFQIGRDKLHNLSRSRDSTSPTPARRDLQSEGGSDPGGRLTISVDLTSLQLLSHPGRVERFLAYKGGRTAVRAQSKRNCHLSVEFESNIEAASDG